MTTRTIIGSLLFITIAMLHGQTVAAPPPGFLHVDAKAGCVFGNAQHHWFKVAGDGIFFGLVFETDDADAQPVAIEIVATEEARQKMTPRVRKFYHNHGEEVGMGELSVPDMQGEEAKKMLAFLATTSGRMIIISELADSGPHRRTHIPTEARPCIGTFWKYIP